MTTTTITADHLARLARTGHALPLDEARAAAAEGRLWAVDTGSDGEDSVLDADTADEALDAVAMHCRGSDYDPDVDLRETRGWSVARVAAIVEALA